jgi:hypothetical protein
VAHVGIAAHPTRAYPGNGEHADYSQDLRNAQAQGHPPIVRSGSDDRTSAALAGFEAGRRERSVGLHAVLAKHGSRRVARLLTDQRTSAYA